MPFPILAVAAGVSAAASIFGGISANKNAKASAKAQRKLAGEQITLGRMNIANIRAEGTETLRKTDFEQGQIEGTTQAISAASGLGGKSRDVYMQMMHREHKREIDWIGKSIKSKSDIAWQETMVASKATLLGAKATKAQGTASLFSGISNAAGTIISAVPAGGFGGSTP